MIKHAFFNNHPLIKDKVIKNIPQITIICGPNNSGKTTVLSSINSNQVSPGITLTEDISDTLCSEYTVGTKFLSGGLLNIAGIELQEAIDKTSKEIKILFKNSIKDYCNKLKTNYNNTRNAKRYTFDENKVINNLNILFTEQSLVVLPPKRNLESIVSINNSDNVSPNGTGLLNKLFFMKNQPSTTYGRDIFNRLSNAFNDITGGYIFDIYMGEANRLELQFSPKEDLWLNAEKCGLGLQDILVIIYFSLISEFEIICIEEPESHLHPDMQRRLLFFLKTLTKKQFFITSHSNVFLDNAVAGRILVTSYNNKISISDVTSRASLLDDLGYSVADNLVSDLVILVEGPSDVPILEELFVKMGLAAKHEIKIWPLGGDIMDQLDLSIFAESYKIIALIDKDPGSSTVRKRFGQKCKDNDIRLFVLKRYAIENYFTIDALTSVFKSQINPSIKKLQPNKSLESQIGINVKKNNRKITRLLNIEDILDTDLGEFLKEVKSLCEA